jgi:hypothetical protein
MTPQAVPTPVFQLPCLAESSNKIVNSPMPTSRQTRSQTTIQTQDIPNVPLPPRVVTPRTLCPSPPRVPTRSRRLSPRNLYQDDFCGMEPLVTTAPIKRCHPPRHRKRNGILGTHEGSPSPTTLEARVWQRMWTPILRN